MSQKRRVVLLALGSDARARQSVERALARHFSIRVEGDCYSAIARLESVHVDVAIIDLQSGQRGTFDLVRRVCDRSPMTRVIVITGGEDERGFDSTGLGAVMCIRRPYTTQALLSA